MGRRVVMTKVLKDNLIKALSEGNTLTMACEMVGISRSTEWYYRRSHPDWKERVMSVLECRNEIVEDALYAKAASGDYAAARFWLVNRAPDKWKPEANQVRLSTDDNRPLPIRCITEVVVEKQVEHPSD